MIHHRPLENWTCLLYQLVHYQYWLFYKVLHTCRQIRHTQIFPPTRLNRFWRNSFVSVSKTKHFFGSAWSKQARPIFQWCMDPLILPYLPKWTILGPKLLNLRPFFNNKEQFYAPWIIALRAGSPSAMLMRLGSPNRIVVVELKFRSEFDHRLSSIRISRF